MDTSNLKELYVVGRPRSGTVWLSLLLCDALNSPLEALGPGAEAARYFGPGHDGEFVIRKKHDEIWRAPTVFIQRDPRDVAVSTMHFRQQTDLFPVVKQMCWPYENSYELHIRKWLDNDTKAEYYTKYELLQNYTLLELSLIIFALTGINLEDEYLRAVVQRQSFESVKAGDTEGRLDNSMYKGVVGEWKTHFTREVGEYMQHHLGHFMIDEGYISNENWWKELPDDI